MNYKITLYNSKFYKEIKLEDKMSKGILIGTRKDCQVRFFKEQFLMDFFIRISAKESGYVMESDKTVLLRKDNSDMTYMLEISPQDVVAVYDASGLDLFKIGFAIDFDVDKSDYSRQIAISGQPSFSIGGHVGSTLRINDNSLGIGYVMITKTSEGYILNQEHMGYNVMINGYQTDQPNIRLDNHDFFSLNKYSFYLNGEILYTSRYSDIQTQLPTTVTLLQGNHLKYPCFVKSARQQFEIPTEKIEILPPKTKQEPPKKNLIATMIPLIMSMGMRE